VGNKIKAMDTIDTVFKSYLSDKYAYSIPLANKVYTAKIYPIGQPDKVLAQATDKLKTKAFAMAIGGLMRMGLEVLNLPKEFSSEFSNTEFK
jgi:hypothetical protein